MNYRFFSNPKTGVKVIVFNNGYSHGNNKAFTMKSLKTGKEKYRSSAAVCESYLTDRGFVKECETRKKLK